MKRLRYYHQTLLGNYGEFLAKRYLIKSGYKILANNWWSEIGELDIIASKGHVLVFVEVKTKTAKDRKLDYFEAANRVDAKKQRRIKKIAGYFCLINKKEIKRRLLWSQRFDVIGINVNSFLLWKIEHRERAF